MDDCTDFQAPFILLPARWNEGLPLQCCWWMTSPCKKLALGSCQYLRSGTEAALAIIAATTRMGCCCRCCLRHLWWQDGSRWSAASNARSAKNNFQHMKVQQNSQLQAGIHCWQSRASWPVAAVRRRCLDGRAAARSAARLQISAPMPCCRSCHKAAAGAKAQAAPVVSMWPSAKTLGTLWSKFAAEPAATDSKRVPIIWVAMQARLSVRSG